MTTPLEVPIPHNSAFASEEHLFQHLEAYPWSTDEEFQNGLRSILGSTPPPEAQKGSKQDELILQAKCFYYARKTGKAIDFQAFKSWLRSKGNGSKPPIPVPQLPSIDATIEDNLPPKLDRMTPPLQHPQPASQTSKPTPPPPIEAQSSAPGPTPPTPPAGPYPTSFAQIVELIESGKPIPGIEDIPDTVLAGQEGPSKEKRRMKPWEMTDVREAGVAEGGALGSDILGGKTEV